MGISVGLDTNKDFEQVTEMIQPAVLADIVDKGMVPNKFKPGSEQHKCYFVWIVAEEDSEGRNKRVFESFTVSAHEKATLRKRLKELGVSIEPGKSFDLDALIGTVRTLVMSTEDSTTPGGKPFIKVTATMKLQKGQTAVAIPADFIRKQDRVADANAPAIKPAPVKPASAPAPAPVVSGKGGPADEITDEDLPF